jgi:hypothetical protein
VVIVIAQGYTKDLFGLRLLDHKPVKVSLDVPGFPVEGQSFLASLALLAWGCVRAIRGMKGRLIPGHVLPHEFLQLALQLFGCRWAAMPGAD